MARPKTVVPPLTPAEIKVAKKELLALMKATDANVRPFAAAVTEANKAASAAKKEADRAMTLAQRAFAAATDEAQKALNAAQKEANAKISSTEKAVVTAQNKLDKALAAAETGKAKILARLDALAAEDPQQ